jgi:hypothetical protein
LTDPRAANKRLLIGGEPLSNTAIVDALRELSESEIPELKGRLPAPSDEAKGLVIPQIKAEAGNAVAGPLRSAKETFGDAAKRLLELEKILGVTV